MKTRLLNFVAKTDWLYKLAKVIIACRIVRANNPLTPEYLESKGWIFKDEYWVEPNVKARDMIWVQFEAHYFRVWHGEQRTFIALESSKDWFDVYYLLAHGDNGRYELAGV